MGDHASVDGSCMEPILRGQILDGQLSWAPAGAAEPLDLDPRSHFAEVIGTR